LLCRPLADDQPAAEVSQLAEAKKYGFKYGSDYPKQIVDHKFARQRTLNSYSEAKDSFFENQEG